MKKRGKFKKKIGYIQLIFGILLIISIFFTYSYIKIKVNTFSESITYGFDESKLDSNSFYDQGSRVSFNMVYLFNYFTKIFIYLFEGIIFLFSMIFILQGLVNINEN